MKYPVWFPYPSCWFKTLILSIFLSLVVFLIRVVGRISFSAISLSTVFVKDSDPMAWVVLGWLIILGFILPIFLFAHLHQFLWSDRNPKLPAWMPNWFSLGEGLWAWEVTIMGFIIGLLMIEEFSGGPLKKAIYYGIEPTITETQAKIGLISWYFTSAYLYHMRLLLGRLFDRFKNGQPKNS